MPSPTAFVFAHPGHEFRLLDTLREGPAVVSIFTQGSRAATCTDRITASQDLAARLGAKRGPVFGAATDRDFYQAILARDVAFFETLVTRLASSFLNDKVSRVVLDSWQNYNPIHDLTHLCGRLAVHRCQQITGRALPVFDYPVVFGELAGAPIGPIASTRTLDDTQVAAKRAAIDAYPDIAADAQALIRLDGEQALRLETLHRLLPLDQLAPTTAPFYEHYGRQRVASGSYDQVIGWQDVQAIATGLSAHHSTALRDAA